MVREMVASSGKIFFKKFLEKKKFCYQSAELSTFLILSFVEKEKERGKEKERRVRGEKKGKISSLRAYISTDWQKIIMKSACSPAAIIGTVPCTLPYWPSHLVFLVRHVIFTPTALLKYCKIQRERYENEKDRWVADGWRSIHHLRRLPCHHSYRSLPCHHSYRKLPCHHYCSK
ncbi:hypothetical protein WUBG_05269 [Wuchereria bancrofti]|uniref:Uncharacterized protein n=1 Tax=Wuchereria bancrofti TaxID=6293 RepID=J9F2X9_WUCBA|nr:hypothetical protein WUBG_05269 [Wuchereria bancrofti]